MGRVNAGTRCEELERSLVRHFKDMERSIGSCAHTLEDSACLVTTHVRSSLRRALYSSPYKRLSHRLATE